MEANPWYLDPYVVWPLFPLLMLIVIVCLTWAMVRVVRRAQGTTAVCLQAAALVCYLLAAMAALASEARLMPDFIHRPFSLLVQLAIALALFHLWGKDRLMVALNSVAWAAILADTALHFILHR
ncbi:MAG: hypothetical protein ACKOBZ_02790 [Nitrospira sp.]|nr:hypothetical protein [Nitrospira sp.]